MNSAVEKTFDMRKVAAIIKKNWLVLKSDTLRLVPLIMFPLVMVVLFGYTAGATPKYIQGAIVDYDNSDLSHAVQADLYGTDMFSIKYRLGSQDEGKKLIDSGDIKILFIIPPGFEKDVSEGKTAYLSMIVDESDPSVAQVTKASTRLFIQGVSQRLLASKISAVNAEAASLHAGMQNFAQQLAALSDGAAGFINGAVTSSVADSSANALDAHFHHSQLLAQQADQDSSDKIQVLQHNIGAVLLDPNDVAGAYESGNIPHYQSVYDILTVSDRQGYLLEQIAVHKSFKATISYLSGDNSKLYADAKNLQAAYENEKFGAANSGKAFSALTARADELAGDSGRIPVDVVSVSAIEPYGTGRRGLDFLLPNILALIVFQGAVAGLGRAVAGERKDGSLTRVFLTPTSNITIIGGTQLFYVLLESIRSSLIVFVAAALFGVSIKGSLLDVVLIICLYAVGTTGVGMVLSVVAKSQDQYMALSMLVTLPMMFLAGVFFPIQTMPPLLQAITRALPITYAADALRGVMIKGFVLSQVVPDLAFLAGFGIVTVGLSTIIFKRELV